MPAKHLMSRHQSKTMILASLSQTTRRRYATIIGALGAFMPCVYAQTAPAATSAATDDKAEVLSPFQVNTQKDTGYAAADSLSGSRMNTPLKITPASISVMTKEFLEDFNITDVNQAAAWTIGMEAATGGESGPFGGNRFQSNFRGAGTSGNYPFRDGLLDYYVADSYNSERFEFSRGPNATLFGDAGPGGLQGSSSKRARLNNQATSLFFQGDSYGGYRTTLDTNFGKDRFALRLNVLNQDIKWVQDRTSNKENAISLAATFKITEKTELRAEFERAAEWNIQYRKTYNENASIWDRTTVNNDNSALGNNASATLATYGLSQLSTTSTAGVTGNDYLLWNFGTNSLMNYKGNQYQTVGLGYAIPWKGRPDLPRFVSGVSKEFSLGPEDSIADRDYNRKYVTLEHRFLPNLGLQLVFNTSDIDPVTQYSQNLPSDYRIDVNRLLPTGAPNPNFGKAYSDFTQAMQYQQNGLKEYQANLGYSFAVPKWFDLKQRLTLNVGTRTDLYEAWSRAYRWINNPLAPDWTSSGAGTGGVTNQSTADTLRYRIYWDQPGQKIAPVLPPTTPGYQFRNVDTGFAALNDRKLSYGGIFSQTTFWDDRLALSLGIRRDKIEDDTLSNIGFTTDANHTIIMGTNGVAGAHGKNLTYKTSKTGGLVLYPFADKFGPWISPIGFTFNYSQNFGIPPTGNPLINGRNPDPPYAETKDVGMRFSMPNNKAFLTVTHYNTEQLGNLGTFGSAADLRTIYTNLGYTDPNRVGTTAFNYRDTSSVKLEGWEAELTANPTRNLTLTANYAHNIARTIIDSTDRRAFVAANIAEFRAGAAATQGQVLNGRTILDPIQIQNALLNVENSLNGSTAGTIQNRFRAHKVNLAGAYGFSDGVLKGLRFSAGVQYRSHFKAGSRDARIKFQDTQTNVPVSETVAAAFDYLWTKPTWDTNVGANYTYNIGKYRLRFQLNVTNVLNDDDARYESFSTINAGQLQGVSNGTALTVPNGNPRVQVPSGFVQPDPRKYVFSTTLSF